MRKTILTEEDYNTFYKAILYGKIDDPVWTAVNVAYRDLCRTITGFSKNKDHDEILRDCKAVLYDDINNEILKKTKLNQKSFDVFHELICRRLICFSRDILTYGQAQKWLNMSLKYVSTFNHKLTENSYEFYHVPIDNYILQETKYKLNCAWSRLNSYNEYLEFQKWFRNNYDGIPLDVEFNMWLKAGKGM